MHLESTHSVFGGHLAACFDGSLLRVSGGARSVSSVRPALCFRGSKF